VTVPDIKIPADLLPIDGRFGSGPTKVRPSALAALAATGTSVVGTSHRQQPVKSLVGEIRTGLRTLFSAPDGYEVVLGNGGSTGFWDAAAFGLIRQRSAHLVLGEFSSKFAAVTAGAPFLADPVVASSFPGSAPELVPVADVDAYAWPHNETSTGVMLGVRRPAGAGTLAIVDATSAAGGLDVDISQTDAYYFAPQKSFGSDGGLWLALMSPAALERIAEIGTSGRWIPPSLDLTIAVDNSRKDQTYNTPAVVTLWLLADQLRWMLAGGGLPFCVARTTESSDLVYDWAQKTDYVTPFVTQPQLRSRVVATLEFDSGVPAATISAVLRANGVVDVDPYRGVGLNQLRIGMFPSVDPDDVAALLACIEHIVDHV
jgi:phosphoserine aminotransferase